MYICVYSSIRYTYRYTVDICKYIDMDIYIYYLGIYILAIDSDIRY